jgi:cell division protein ZapA (FtsZ GTPase activity inhibitor)
MDELSISVSIADRSYKLAVEKEQEELVRKAVRTIDIRLKEYSNNYAYKDKQDLLAMVALEFTTSYLQAERKNAEKEDHLENRLVTLNTALTDFLKIPVA